MRLKLISYYLLVLFGVVIAFPGYGTTVASKKSRQGAVCIQEQADPAWKLILKKCLSKGINMIEEERNVEEDEVSESGLMFYHAPCDPFSIENALYISRHEAHHWFENSCALNQIFSPPEHL